MQQKESQNSNRFDGKYLRMTKQGVMYKYGEKTPLQDALSQSVGGRKFKNIYDAFKHSRKKLEER